MFIYKYEGIFFKYDKSSLSQSIWAEFNLIDGVKGALDSTFIPWTENDDVYSHDTIIFTSPPEVYTYSSLNGYYANEVYSESKTILASTNAGPTAHDLR